MNGISRGPGPRLLAIAALFAVSLALCLAGGCGSQPGGATSPNDGTGTGQLPIRYGFLEIRVPWPDGNQTVGTPGAVASIRMIPAETAVLRVSIAGAGMEPIRTDITEADAVSGIASRRIPVPVGTQRTVEIRALDGDGATIAAGQTTVDIVAGQVARARVVLVANDGTQPPVTVTSRTFYFTMFQGNFQPSAVAPQPAGASVASARQVPAAPVLPNNVLAASVTLDFFGELENGDRPVVATVIMHNQFELWIVRGFYQGPMLQEMTFDTSIRNDYLVSPGGFTNEFQGSLIDTDILIGPILDPIFGPGDLIIGFDGPDPIGGDTIDGSIDVGAGPIHTLIGDFDGVLVF